MKSFEDLQELYIDTLKNNNYSTSTIQSYLYHLSWLQKYLYVFEKTDVREISKTDMEFFLAYIQAVPSRDKENLSKGTIEGIEGTINCFFTYLEKEEYIFSNPFLGLHKRKRHRKVLPKDVLTDNEMKRIFKAVNLHTAVGYRDRIILEILYTTGIRNSELTHLDVSDIDLVAGILYVRQGKGKKDRVVPLTDMCISYLKEYLKRVRPILLKLDLREERLFVTEHGEGFKKGTLVKIINKYGKLSGVEKQVTTHLFRHTFASHMIKQGAKVRYVQEILGHANLSTTRIYTKVYIKDLKAAVKQYHPRENDLHEYEPIESPNRMMVKDSEKVLLKRL